MTLSESSLSANDSQPSFSLNTVVFSPDEGFCFDSGSEQGWEELLSYKSLNFLASLSFLRTEEVRFLGRQMTQKIVVWLVSPLISWLVVMKSNFHIILTHCFRYNVYFWMVHLHIQENAQKSPNSSFEIFICYSWYKLLPVVF